MNGLSLLDTFFPNLRKPAEVFNLPKGHTTLIPKCALCGKILLARQAFLARTFRFAVDQMLAMYEYDMMNLGLDGTLGSASRVMVCDLCSDECVLYPDVHDGDDWNFAHGPLMLTLTFAPV